MTVQITLQIMYARNVDHRSAVFQKVLEVGEAYQLRTKVLCACICPIEGVQVRDATQKPDLYPNPLYPNNTFDPSNSVSFLYSLRLQACIER